MSYTTIEDSFTIEDLGSTLLTDLAEGLYQPNEVIREYVQNAVDAHRLVENKTGFRPDNNIHIEFGEKNRSLVFHDYGIGMSKEEIKDVKSIGISDKPSVDANLTGYKGVGIWAGFSFFDKISLRSTRSGSNSLYELLIDFESIREAISYDSHIGEVLNQHYEIRRYSEDEDISYTFAELSGARDDFFMSPSRVKDAVRETCPCKIDPSFEHKDAVEEWYKNEGFSFFPIMVDGDMVYRSYPSGTHQPVTGSITVEDTTVAKYWHCLTKGNGVLSTSENEMLGFRVFQRGFIIGERNLYGSDQLSGYADINTQNYLRWQFGEFHVISDDLKPKIQRDEFESSDYTELFIKELRDKYKDFEKEARVTSEYNKLMDKYERCEDIIEDLEDKYDGEVVTGKDIHEAEKVFSELHEDKCTFEDYKGQQIKDDKVLAVRRSKQKRRRLLTRLEDILPDSTDLNGEDGPDEDEESDDSDGSGSSSPDASSDDSSDANQDASQSGSESSGSDNNTDDSETHSEDSDSDVHPGTESVSVSMTMVIIESALEDHFDDNDELVSAIVQDIKERIYSIISDE